MCDTIYNPEINSVSSDVCEKVPNSDTISVSSDINSVSSDVCEKVPNPVSSDICEKVLKYARNECGDYVCQECGIKKKHHNTMFYHMKMHSGNRSYECPTCDKSFIQKSGLQQHLKTHETVSEFKCPCCKHTAKQKPNMLIHIGRKHGAGWIPDWVPGTNCSCGKEIKSPTSYYYHAVQCFTPPFDISFGNKDETESV